MLTGKEIPDKIADFINVNSDELEVEYVFELTNNKNIYKSSYSITLGKTVALFSENNQSTIFT